MKTANPRRAACAVAMLLAVLPCGAGAQVTKSPGAKAPAATPLPAQERPLPPGADAIHEALTVGSFQVVDGSGKVVSSRRRGRAAMTTMNLAAIADAIRQKKPSSDQTVALWGLLADEDHSGLVTLPLVKALAAATDKPRTREALWSELSELTKAKRSSSASSRALLALFEGHRKELLAILPDVRETEGGGDEMAMLMTASRVFGDDIWQSLFDMVVRNPGAVARLIERERERGRPVKWEFQGFEGMMRWKDAHLVAGAPQAPRSLKALDRASETFITIFNALHSLDEWYRSQMLRGLGPVELFNAVVGGEQELYRLGTSGYRGFLHPIIMKGIKESGSFEAFLDKAAPTWLQEMGPATRSRRGMIFVRIASSFGLLDGVLEAVQDRDRFIAQALSALGDPLAFEGSSTIVLDVLTVNLRSERAKAFRQALIERLYGAYENEADPARRSVYGSMLSAYQAVAGDKRNPAIERDYALDRSLLQAPFARLFSIDERQRLVHRMFMRMHDDIDGKVTYSGFRTLMRSMGATISDQRRYSIYNVASGRRRIEIYVNHPSDEGVKRGISDIAERLEGADVHTIIGRGHTGIITPLQRDARLVLGKRADRLAAVIVGACGGDASVREMVGTFGYVPIIATKSTGRQVLNNAIVKAYVRALLDLRDGQMMSLTALLDKALAPYTKKSMEQEVREDAELYRVNLGVAIAARLFDTHVKRHIPKERYAGYHQ